MAIEKQRYTYHVTFLLRFWANILLRSRFRPLAVHPPATHEAQLAAKPSSNPRKPKFGCAVKYNAEQRARHGRGRSNCSND
eukprot:3092710-Prymnesium_polylepis.1